MRAFAYCLVALLGIACTQVLGIDGDYSVEAPATGTGGAGGAGGNDGTGGGATDDAAVPCPSGTKTCLSKTCVYPDPSIGCGFSGCDPCPAAPANGFGVCVNQQCDFQCKPGFNRSAKGTCDAPATSTGGQPGTGGRTGTTTCVPSSCATCGPFPGCCDPISRKCGCLYVAACI